MRILKVFRWAAKSVFAGLLVASCLLAQSDRGTITGAIIDPTGAVIAGVNVSATNQDNGTVSRTVSTETGNFTLPSLSAGLYELSADAPGFVKYVQRGVRVQVAETARVDIRLTIGSASDSVVVTADAALLKTEGAEQSTTVNGDAINTLPINFGGGGQGTGAIRDPTAFVNLSPGVQGNGAGATINGMPSGSFRLLYEGQDSTDAGQPTTYAAQTQGSAETIGEFTLQSQNMSAEYGQAAGGTINFTTKSGTNQFHGSGYEYFANEAFDAAQPYGGHVRPKDRKNDWGFTIGGPVMLPKLYNGRNRTFFFFSLEKFDNSATNSMVGTMPTQAMRNGDFSALLTGRTLGTDSAGAAVLENAIYDPLSSATVNGQMVRTVFPGNVIPQSRMDPVALKAQALVPLPTNPNLQVNNWTINAPNPKHQQIPTVKIDEQLTPTARISGYFSGEWSHLYSNVDGLPAPLTAIRDQQITAYTNRINFDQSVTPTILVHAGIGYIRFNSPDSSPSSVLNYDAVKNLGFTGGLIDGMPRINGFGSSLGGVVDLGNGFGPTNANEYYNDKGTAVLSATWVHGSHTFKIGGELRIDSWTDRNTRGATGVLNFSNNETADIVNQSASVGGGSTGFSYASFLLGQVDSATVNPPQDPQLRRKGWALYIQDNWKITSKLTLDYGLRWDLQYQGDEIRHRMSMFGPSVPNENAGGLPGGLVYEGNGPGRCNCNFYSPYPFAIGPRLGIAYQLNPKTVLRGGFGVEYGPLQPFNWITNNSMLGTGWDQLTFGSPATGVAGVNLSQGLKYNPASLYAVTLDPGAITTAGQLNNPNYYLDRNAARPPRILAWNVGVQREITQNLTAEAAYVGNQGVWLNNTGLINLDALNPAKLQSLGFNVANAADRSVLTSTFASGIPQAHGFQVPYAGFPLGSSLAQALRPFPQFTNIPAYWAPLGDSWYDSLQMKLTKRFSHGLTVQGAYTWSHNLSMGGANNVFNRSLSKSVSSIDQTSLYTLAFTYELPKMGSNKLIRQIVGGWTVGGIVSDASGTPIASPTSNNTLSSVLFQNTRFNRVPGVPLFTKNLNCNCIDPNKDFVLNPAAWSDAAPGTWGSAAPYYDDYRGERRPTEQASLGRMFHIREKMFFEIRAEFFNLFNRYYLGNPTSSNPAATQVVRNAVPISGFGYINANSPGANQRNGQLVARFQF
ncbi:MAG: TonB-dependent receptor [Ignavibacteriota bacterium]